MSFPYYERKKIRMIKKNESLPLEPIFAFDKYWHCNACLSWWYAGMELYVLGYKKSADSLVAQVIETGNHQDFLVFPVCFLYRQYIELRLKEVISSGRRFLEEKGTFPQHHKIQHLWESAIAILKKVFPEDSELPNLLLLPGHVVSEFSKLDPDSVTFRYPTDKNGEKFLEGISHINLRRLAEYVNEFAKFMDAGSMAISVYLDQKNEMNSYIED